MDLHKVNRIDNTSDVFKRYNNSEEKPDSFYDQIICSMTNEQARIATNSIYGLNPSEKQINILKKLNEAYCRKRNLEKGRI